MMGQNPAEFDVIVVGSGPAGVSAAFPLLEAGLSVLMVDGGREAQVAPPVGQFTDVRRHDTRQWEWMIGRDFYALRQIHAVSPKLRVPTHAAVFEGFEAANRIAADDFVAVGSLAPGGLSNAWGCGVACFTVDELAAFPVTRAEMYESYGAVATRIGVSGGHDDDLSDFFGLDAWSQTSIPIDEIQGSLLANYRGCRETLQQSGFRLGRARVAALTAPMPGRQSCDRSGSCLWGCKRRALYSAIEDLGVLRGRPGFHYRSGFVVEMVIDDGTTVTVKGLGPDGAGTLRARRVLLAAGTLATTRLALQMIDHRAPVSMQSCPTAAFLLWLPFHLGRTQDPAFGLGQLSFELTLANGTQGFGSLFNATAIPVTEFARYMPFGKRYSVDLLASLLTSCVVGNVFLPGAMTDVRLRLDANDRLEVRGRYRNEVPNLMKEVKRRLSVSLRRLGAVLIPASFQIGRPGSDIHYAASLPMRAEPMRGQTDRYGQLLGTAHTHVVDGASLSSLPAKSHTLTIMANADRIGKHIARIMRDTKCT